MIKGSTPINDVAKQNASVKEGYETVNERFDKGETVEFSDNGLFHTAIPVQTVVYKDAPNEKVIQNEGAYLVLGTDRPGGLASGYGGQGSNRANSIDLVVGRMSNARSGKGPPGAMGGDGAAYVDNSFFADAARIHISQLTNIDKNFGIAEGNTQNIKARSGVAIKADAVRVIGREGVKIVTGEADSVSGYGISGEPNSLGGKIVKPAPSIDLIAGNNTGDYITFGGIFNPIETINILQPAVKGDFTKDAFLELGNIIEDLWACTYALTLTQIIYNAILGISFFEPWRAGASSIAVTSQLSWVMNSMYHTRTNKTFWEFNYLNPAGYKYICSRNVNLT